MVSPVVLHLELSVALDFYLITKGGSGK